MQSVVEMFHGRFRRPDRHSWSRVHQEVILYHTRVPATSVPLGGFVVLFQEHYGHEFAAETLENPGMVQKRPFSGNTRDLSADPDRSRVGAGLRESLAAVLGLQFRENRVYPRSSSQ